MAFKIDSILQRMSHLSQLGLLFLALFGYIYTVRPIYSKSLLEEEVAKKQIEMKDKDKYIANANIEIQNKKYELDMLQKEINSVRSNLEVASQKYSNTKAELLVTVNLLNRSRNEAILSNAELNKLKAASYQEVKLKVLSLLIGNSTRDCLGSIVLIKGGKPDLFMHERRDFKLLGPCVDKALKSDSFIQVFDLLSHSDKDKLVQLAGNIGKRTSDNINSLKASYNTAYDEYIKVNADYNRDKDTDIYPVPKDLNPNQVLAYRIERGRNIINKISNNSLSYIEYESKVSNKYDKILSSTFDWMKSEFIDNKVNSQESTN